MAEQVFAKGAKFSMFKPAEEMVYIGLDQESRTKGKAAIDVVGAQSGKSAGSILQQVSISQFWPARLPLSHTLEESQALCMPASCCPLASYAVSTASCICCLCHAGAAGSEWWHKCRATANHVSCFLPYAEELAKVREQTCYLLQLLNDSC